MRPGSLGLLCLFSVLSSQRVSREAFLSGRLGFCALEVSVHLGGIVLKPVLAHQSLLWLSLLLSLLATSFSCLRVWLLFWCVGIQASVFPVHPLFNSATLIFLAQLPVISFDSTFSA